MRLLKTGIGGRGPMLKLKVLIWGSLALILGMANVTSVYAIPRIPHQLYGNVSIGGIAAESGKVVTAKIGGVTYASTTTDAQGRYGYTPVFTVPADDPDTLAKEGGVSGDIIELYVDNNLASTTVFQNGTIQQLNLVISGTQPTTTSGGGGGGGGFGSQLIGINLSGNSPFMDGNGKSITAGEIKTSDGKLTIGVSVGVAIWNAAGAAQSFLSANTPTIIPNEPAQQRIIYSYEMGPNGVTFTPGATLSFTYSSADVAGVSETSLYIAWWDGTAWVKLNSEVNSTAKTVSATIVHFTTFALIGQQAQSTTTSSPPPTTLQPTTVPPPTTPPTNPAITTASTTMSSTTSSEESGETNWVLFGGIVAAALIIGSIVFSIRRRTAK